MSNTFKLQFKVKLKLKRGNEESNPGGKFWSNTFKLQFKVKLELKRGNAPWCISHFWRLTSSLRLNWRLNATFSFSLALMVLAFKLQFKLKLELKLHM